LNNALNTKENAMKIEEQIDSDPILNCEIFEENGEFIVYCKDLGIYVYGKSVEEAKRRMRLVIDFYLEEFRKSKELHLEKDIEN